MSIAVNVFSLCRSDGATSEATAAFKHMIMSALQKLRPHDQAFPVSMLESNVNGRTKALLHEAINELRESGAIEFAYSEGWTVGLRLTTKDLACPRLVHSRSTGWR